MIDENKTIADKYPRIYLYRRIVQAKLFIDQHYDEKIDLHNIADEAHFSKFHFIRLFKSIYGKTPNQYLVAVRIEKAQLLLQQNTSVRDACFLVGYDSVSTFSGLFSRITGKTPSRYLNDYQHRKKLVGSRPLEFVPGCYAYLHGWSEK
jgi:AraC-like DNA-binding protein